MESEREVGTRRIERDWSWHLGQAARQGKSLAQYAREHRLSVSNLYQARHASKRLAQVHRDGEAPAPFVPVKLAAPLPVSDRMSIHARLRNGVTVDLMVENADSLRSLLNVLSRLPCSD